MDSVDYKKNEHTELERKGGGEIGKELAGKSKGFVQNTILNVRKPKPIKH